MLNSKPSIFFNLGISLSVSVIILVLLIASYFYGYTLGIFVKSYIDIIEIGLGFIFLFTIPALFVLALVHGTIPRELKMSFYSFENRYLFLSGASMPITIFLISLIIYFIFLAIPEYIEVLMYIEVIVILTVPFVLVKIAVLLKKTRKNRDSGLLKKSF